MRLGLIKYMVLLFLGSFFSQTHDSFNRPPVSSDCTVKAIPEYFKDARFRFSARMPWNSFPIEKSKPVSDQKVFKEYRKGFADRGKEYAGQAFCGLQENYPVFSGIIMYHAHFVYSPRPFYGQNSIRPPPVC